MLGPTDTRLPTMKRSSAIWVFGALATPRPSWGQDFLAIAARNAD